MKLAKLDVCLLKLLFLCAACILVFQVLGSSGLTSILFYTTFPLTVLLWLRTVRKTVTGQDLLVAMTIALAVICVLIDAGIHSANLNFNYVKKVIMFSMTLLFLQTANRIRVQKDMVTFINRIVDLLTLFLLLMFVTRTRQMYSLNGRGSAYLTFRIGNPNLTGLFLTVLYMLELYRIFTPEKWYQKMVHVLLALALVFFVILTQSRNCIIVMVFYTLICTWLIFRSRRNLRVKKIVAFLIAVFPLLFAAIYLLFVATPWMKKTFSFLVSAGKNLDSRVRIWQMTVRHISKSPVLGAYFGVSDGSGMSQMHNSHLDIAASYGIPVLAVVCILLRNYVYQGGRVYENKQDYIYILGFACAIILGIGEAALFSGGLGLHVFVGAFLMLSSRDNEIEMVNVL